MCHPDRDHFSRVTNEDLQKEIGDLRRDFQDQLDKQRRMFTSEMKYLVLRLKDVKDKEEQEEDTNRLDGGKQRRFSSPQ